MNKVGYLNTLRKCLSSLPQDEIEDIIRDYREHFDVGISKGKTEEEISEELGSPVEIAKEYGVSPNFFRYERVVSDEVDNDSYYNEEGRKEKFSIPALVFWIFVMVMAGLPILISLYAVLISFFVTAGAVIISGISVAGISLFKLTTIGVGPFLFYFGMALCLIGLGGVLINFLIWLTKKMFYLTGSIFNGIKRSVVGGY
ncbi:MAG: DUF1700 domain-containing protein [Tissierellia bacterium]|nr:DUF1700 domain-containing protein [Tissierellia bacterium]